MNDADRCAILHTLANLRVYRRGGQAAPHKPILLLVMLDLAQRGELAETVRLTPELAFRFCAYWGVVAHRRTQRPDIRLPFHHTSSDGLWAALQADMRPSRDCRSTDIARLSPQFVALAHDADDRDTARHLLIAQYFQPEERMALYTLLGLPAPSGEQTDAVLRAAADDAQQQGREARFRLEVVPAYNYTCALTGYRLLTVDVGSIVDAAHIHPFSDSRNNDPRNGMALCKNAHWTFDQGLWTVTDDYRVLVADDRFCEDSPDGRALAGYAGQPLRLPRDQSFWPSPKCLAWHREHRFQGAVS